MTLIYDSYPSLPVNRGYNVTVFFLIAYPLLCLYSFKKRSTSILTPVHCPVLTYSDVSVNLELMKLDCMASGSFVAI